MMQRLIVTGGCGFIGSNFILHMIKKYPSYKIVNVDNLTYSGNLNNLNEIEKDEMYSFVKENICSPKMANIIQERDIVINFAAESHVDNSIKDSSAFIETNVLGTYNLLETARKNMAKLFVQISTDEVYGSLNFDGRSSKETDSLNPSSPYSASKAAAEMICLGNIKTFKQPIIITRSSNNFGPYQFPEKVLPLFVTNILEGKKLPLYGDGKNIRDWIYVKDNCDAIDFIIHNGLLGEIYNICGKNELNNLNLTKQVLKQMGVGKEFIEYVKDRPGHDLRYSLDCSKINSLGWYPKTNFQESLKETIIWYRNNSHWWRPLK